MFCSDFAISDEVFERASDQKLKSFLALKGDTTQIRTPAALERGSAAAFSAINRGNRRNEMTVIAREQLENLKEQIRLEEENNRLMRENNRLLTGEGI